MAKSFRYKVYLSTDTTISSADYLAYLTDVTGEQNGVLYSAGIQPGETVRFTHSCIDYYYLMTNGSSAVLNTGTYYIGVILDTSSEVIENNELDNISSIHVIHQITIN